MDTIEDAEIGRRHLRRGWLLVALWMIAMAVVRAGTVTERDTFWQARAGLENLAGQPLVRPDSWSWAPLDEPFRQTSPGWNAVLGIAWDVGGFAGSFIVGVGAILAYCLGAVLLAHHLGVRPVPSLVGFLASFGLAFAMLSPRASLVAHALFLGAILIGYSVFTAARERRYRALSLLVAILGFLVALLGNWIHTSWLLLSALTGLVWSIFWLLLIHLPMSTRIRLILGTALGLALGTLLGPHRSDILTYSMHVRAQCEDVIVEWMSVLTPQLAARWLPVTLVALVLVANGLVRLWRRRTLAAHDPRLPLAAGLLIVGLGFALASFEAIRFAGSALLTLAPVSGAAVTALARWIRVHVPSDSANPLSPALRRWTFSRPWAVVLTITLILLSPGAYVLARPLGAPVPEQALATVLPHDCNLFSTASASSALVLLRPDVRVYIDGRADYWGPDRALSTLDHLAGRTADLVPAGTTCILVDKTAGTGLDAMLRTSRDWTQVSADGHMSVWVPQQ